MRGRSRQKMICYARRSRRCVFFENQTAEKCVRTQKGEIRTRIKRRAESIMRRYSKMRNTAQRESVKMRRDAVVAHHQNARENGRMSRVLRQVEKYIWRVCVCDEKMHVQRIVLKRKVRGMRRMTQNRVKTVKIQVTKTREQNASSNL